MQPFVDVIGREVKAGDMVAWATASYGGGCYMNVGIVSAVALGKPTAYGVSSDQPKLKVLPANLTWKDDVHGVSQVVGITTSRIVTVANGRNVLIISSNSLPDAVREFLVTLLTEGQGAKRGS